MKYLLALTALLAFAAAGCNAPPQDKPEDPNELPVMATVEGCKAATGYIGIQTLRALEGDKATTDLSIGAVDAVRSYTIDLLFPPGIVEFLDAGKGELTKDWAFLGFTVNASGTGVRLSSFAGGGTPITSGDSGALAVIAWRVLDTQKGEFTIYRMQGDAGRYLHACD